MWMCACLLPAAQEHMDDMTRNLDRAGYRYFPISAATGDGLPALLAELGVQLRPVRELVELKIPHEQSAVIARLHKLGQVIESRYLAKAAKFKARIPPHHHAEFAEFIVE